MLAFAASLDLVYISRGNTVSTHSYQALRENLFLLLPLDLKC